jgi:hypothetical protein
MSSGAYFFGAVLTTGIAGWLFWRGDPLAGVLLLPLFGYFAGRSLVVAGLDMFRRLEASEKRPWNGNYYEYGTVHLRALRHGEALVFVEDDILRVIGQQGSGTVALFGPAERVRVEGAKWTTLTEAGCRRLLLKCPHPEAKSLLLYLERQAFGPFAKRRGRTGP